MPWPHFWFALLMLFFAPPVQAADSPPCANKPGQGPEMVVIPAGRFLMGSPSDEIGRQDDEGPQHVVSIQNAFALMRCEVTVAEFALFVTETDYETDAERGKGCYLLNEEETEFEQKKGAYWRSPGFEQAEDHPVVCVSWHDAHAYATWLSQRTGHSYRLPTEAEWEYAARAGTTTPFSSGDCIHTDQANYNGNYDFNNCGAKTGRYRRQTVAVDELDAVNPWGLRHMHGNVWEWAEDCWHGNYEAAPSDASAWLNNNDGDCARRVVRGGGWIFLPEVLRSADRIWFWPVGANNILGFRLARTL